METDWSKVIEVFSSGIMGVFSVMIVLQILTQVSNKIIIAVENLNKKDDASPEKGQSTPSGKA